jgi:hypothetical protein
MAKKVSRENYPWWVKLSLWGLPGRNGLWICAAIAAIASLLCVMSYASSGSPRWFLAPLFLLAALAYWLSIRWVDRNGSWDS